MIVICARVSPGTGRGNDGASLATQVDDLLAHAAANAATMGEVRALIACGPWPEDVTPPAGCEMFPTESGGDDLDQRPGLLRAMELCEPGDTLLFLKPDRLARRVFVHAGVEETLRDKKIALSFVGMPDGDSPEDQLLRTVLAGFAEYERTRIMLRTMRGKREAQKKGGRWGGTAPFGMEYLRDGKKVTGIQICQAEVRVVREVMRMLKQGIKHDDIRAAMVSPRGGTLSPELLVKINNRKLDPMVLDAVGGV